MKALTKDDFTVVNLNDWQGEGRPFPASPIKPTAIVIWNDITPEEAEQLINKILEWQKPNIKQVPKTIVVEEI